MLYGSHIGKTEKTLDLYLWNRTKGKLETWHIASTPPGEWMWFLSPAAWRKGDIVVVRLSVRPAGWASTFIAVSAITHKLFAISIWNLGHTWTTWKGRTLLILGVAGSKMADWGGHLEKNVFCNEWKTAYLISVIFGYYVPHPWGTFSRWWPNGVLFPIHLPHYLEYVWPFSFNGGRFPISDGIFTDVVINGNVHGCLMCLLHVIYVQAPHQP